MARFHLQEKMSLAHLLMAKYTIEFNGAGKLLDGDKVSIQGSYNGIKTFISLLGSDAHASL